MVFQDYILESKLEQYEASELGLDVHKTSEVLLGSKLFISQWSADILSKEKVMENYQDHHNHVNTASKQFYNEFPRKQTNNDLQYHNEDVTLKFIVDWFLNDKKRGD